MRCSSATINPESTNHTIFAIGCLKKLVDTFWPNGTSISPASLKHCRPNGIPIMVTHKISPITAQWRADINPPKISHIKFPKSLITGMFLPYVVKYRTDLSDEKRFCRFIYMFGRYAVGLCNLQRLSGRAESIAHPDSLYRHRAFLGKTFADRAP